MKGGGITFFQKTALSAAIKLLSYLKFYYVIPCNTRNYIMEVAGVEPASMQASHALLQV